MTHLGTTHLSILSSAHPATDTRLLRWVRAAERAGWAVTVRAEHGSGLRRVVRAATLPWRARTSDVLIVLDPELALTALLLRPLHRSALVADVHEDWPTVASDRRWARGPLRWLARLLAQLAVWGSSRADIVVVADDHVRPERARRRVVARNLPARGEMPVGRRRSEEPRAVYVGDVRASRGLATMVDAVLASPPWHLDIIGPVRADATGLLERARSSGRIDVHGRLPFRDAWERAAGASVGLALLDDTPAYRPALPTKLSEYLAAGLAVIVSELPRARVLVEETGAGVAVSSAEDAAAVLRRWHEHPDELDRHREAARGWAAALPETSPFEDAVAEISAVLGSRS